MKDAMKLETHLIVAGRDKRYTRGAVNPVIQRASSLVFDTVKDKKFATANRANGELFYGRRGTYTHFAFQKAMSELEGGVGCALYPCGAAAVTNAILAFVQSGDHILMTGAAYEPTRDFCNKILSKFNVETTYYDPLIGAGIVDLLRPETKVVFLESPSSITMEVQDVPGMVKAIRAVNPEIVIMIDNTGRRACCSKRWIMAWIFPFRRERSTPSVIRTACWARRCLTPVVGIVCVRTLI